MRPDHQWMYRRLMRGRLNQEFVDGLQKFIDFVNSQPEWMDGTKSGVYGTSISARIVYIMIST